MADMVISGQKIVTYGEYGYLRAVAQNSYIWQIRLSQGGGTK